VQSKKLSHTHQIPRTVSLFLFVWGEKQKKRIQKQFQKTISKKTEKPNNFKKTKKSKQFQKSLKFQKQTISKIVPGPKNRKNHGLR